ncbi:H-NS family nucleoid-associated regulatory protein [Metallibacterium scheffleri]|nr:H-NS histone family protein [Metallibacterium scheffleri]
MEFSNMTDEQIEASIAAGKAEKDRREAERKESVVKRIVDDVVNSGANFDDVIRALRDAKAAIKAAAGNEAPYRNPTTGETWSGRGKHPKWISDHVANGGNADDFKVAA